MTIKVTCKAGLRKRMLTKPSSDAPAGKHATRIARMLALAHHVEQLVDDCTLRDYAHAAELLGVSRPRMTQVLGLLNLSSTIQEAILAGELMVSERRVRTVASETCWEAQGKRIT